jgi:hypothetical protein
MLARLAGLVGTLSARGARQPNSFLSVAASSERNQPMRPMSSSSVDDLLRDPQGGEARQRCRIVMWMLVAFWTINSLAFTLTPETACKMWCRTGACSMAQSPELFVSLRLNGAVCAFLTSIFCTQAYHGIFSNHNLMSYAGGLVLLALSHGREAYLHPDAHKPLMAGISAALYLMSAMVFVQSAGALKAAVANRARAASATATTRNTGD